MDKKILTALGISLALNFIFIGFEASRMCCRPAPHVPPARPAFIPGKPMGQFVSPEQKMMSDSFKNVFKNHEKDLKEAKKAVEEALAKEPFDAKKFKEALQKAAVVRKSVDDDVQENMVKMISKMTPEERQRFANGFSKAREHFKHNAGKIRKDFRGKEKHRKDFRPERPERGEFAPHHCKKHFNPGKGRHFQDGDFKDFRSAKKDFRKKMNARKSKKPFNKKYMPPAGIEAAEAPVPQEAVQSDSE